MIKKSLHRTDQGIWASSEDDLCAFFACGFCPRNVENGRSSPIACSRETDRGRSQNVELGIKGGIRRYGGLAKAAATEEGDKGSCPYCGVKGIGEVECLTKGKKVFRGNWGMQGALVASAVTFRSCAAHGDPVVVTIPWGTIDDVPSANTS